MAAKYNFHFTSFKFSHLTVDGLVVSIAQLKRMNMCQHFRIDVKSVISGDELSVNGFRHSGKKEKDGI